MSKNKDSDPRYTGEEGKMVEYAEKKYGQKFVAESYDGGGAYKNIQFPNTVMYPEGDKLKPFMVIKQDNKYRDGYAFRLVEPMVDERIKSIVGNEFPNFKYATFITVNLGSAEFTDNSYITKINYDDFIKKEGNEAIIEIRVFVNYGDELDKHKEAEEIHSFMQKLIDNKLVKSKMIVKACFYFVNQSNYNKINAKKCRYNHADRELSQEYNINTFNTLISQDGLNYNESVEDIEKKFND